MPQKTEEGGDLLRVTRWFRDSPAAPVYKKLDGLESDLDAARGAH